MSHHIRQSLGLTQDRLAAWLGLRRGTLAMSETELRGLPLGMGLPLARLELALLAQVLLPDGQAEPAPPPLPPPPPDPAPLRRRLAECRDRIRHPPPDLRPERLARRSCTARAALGGAAGPARLCRPGN
ncbi:hypothetical protein GCM10022409_07450 [Hymenobacter glaciei]|uniref:HTH cro/C1-type domain-containing protein n=1 Tax=Hymenobacter glaciei TaxID=877209 RepID=A0ABP7TGC3_9BACT